MHKMISFHRYKRYGVTAKLRNQDKKVKSKTIQSALSEFYDVDVSGGFVCGPCVVSIEQYNTAKLNAMKEAGHSNDPLTKRITQTPCTPSGKSPVTKKSCESDAPPLPIAFSTPAPAQPSSEQNITDTLETMEGEIRLHSLDSTTKRKVTRTPCTPSGKSPASKKSCVNETPPIPIAFSTPAAPAPSKCRAQLFTEKMHGIQSSMKQSKYDTAFRHILSYNPKTSKKHFNTVVHNVVADEMKNYVKYSKTFPQFEGIDSLENFQMDDIITEYKKYMPTFYAALSGAFDTNNRRKRFIDPVKEEKRQGLINPRLAFMGTIPLYTRNPRKFKFLQAVNGIQLHKGGATQKVILH